MTDVTKLFPQCVITETEIDWKGGSKTGDYGREQYVEGDREELCLDGNFNLLELEALVAWMQSKELLK